MAKKPLFIVAATAFLTVLLFTSSDRIGTPTAIAKPTWSAQAKCSETGKVGKISGARSRISAEIRAKKACRAAGGRDGCCQIQWIKQGGRKKN